MAACLQEQQSATVPSIASKRTVAFNGKRAPIATATAGRVRGSRSDPLLCCSNFQRMGRRQHSHDFLKVMVIPSMFVALGGYERHSESVRYSTARSRAEIQRAVKL